MLDNWFWYKPLSPSTKEHRSTTAARLELKTSWPCCGHYISRPIVAIRVLIVRQKVSASRFFSLTIRFGSLSLTLACLLAAHRNRSSVQSMPKTRLVNRRETRIRNLERSETTSTTSMTTRAFAFKFFSFAYFALAWRRRLWRYLFIFIEWVILGLFFFIFVFSILCQLQINVLFQLLMAGFEPVLSGVRNNRFANITQPMLKKAFV